MLLLCELQVATSKAAFKLAALSIDSVSIPTSPGALSIASGADAASSPAVSPRKQAPPFAVTDMDGAQRLFFSTASRNPTKKLLCEASNVQSILPYDSQGESSHPHQIGYHVMYKSESPCYATLSRY